MGAVANLAPEAFAGIVAEVPFVDALTTILDPSLPLTVTEWEEWGNPLESAEVYAYMKSYTPYENLAAQRYPAILAVTSLNDTRVLYHEPAKWVARAARRSPPTATTCSRPRWAPGTAAAAAATTPGARRPSSSPGRSLQPTRRNPTKPDEAGSGAWSVQDEAMPLQGIGPAVAVARPADQGGDRDGRVCVVGLVVAVRVTIAMLHHEVALVERHLRVDLP